MDNKEPANHLNRTHIGTATITYDESGRPGSSQFVPEKYIDDHWKGASDALLTSPAIEDAEQAKKHAEVILASWFAHINEIELADREVATIESEVTQCDKWPNGKPSLCVIRFYLQQR